MTRTTLAVRIERHGAPGVLAEREIPLADPGPGEVHLRTLATGVNFADLLIGMWGGLDVMLDPYAGATAGTTSTDLASIMIRNRQSAASVRSRIAFRMPSGMHRPYVNSAVMMP